MKVFVQRTVELIGHLSTCDISTVPEYSVVPPGDTSTSIWPPIFDATLFQIFQQFSIELPNIKKLFINQYLSILFVLQLKLECEIYNIKPSEILGKTCNKNIFQNYISSSSTNSKESYNDFIQEISIIDPQTCISKPIQIHTMQLIYNNNIETKDSSSSSSTYIELNEIRKKFLGICFYRLPLTKFSLVMKLANCLGFDLDHVRIIHISSLLDRCLADADAIVDDVLSHVS